MQIVRTWVSLSNGLVGGNTTNVLLKRAFPFSYCEVCFTDLSQWVVEVRRVRSDLCNVIEFSWAPRAGLRNRQGVCESIRPINAARQCTLISAEHLHFVDQATRVRKLDKAVSKIQI